MEQIKQRRAIVALSALGMTALTALAGFLYLNEPPHQEPVPEAPTITVSASKGLVDVAGLTRALSANTKTLSRLRGEVKRLRKKVTALEQKKRPDVALAPLAARDVLQIEDEWLANEASEVDFETQIEDAKMRSRERFDNIEATFVGEVVDQAWGDAVGSEVQHAFESVAELDNAHLDAMECRAQRCRLEVEFSDDAELEAAQANIAFALADLAPSMAVEYEDIPGAPGRKRAVMYFARTGHEMLED